MTSNNWTPERVELLKKLWQAGVSTSLIGAQMRIGIGAVAGKVKRLKLGTRETTEFAVRSRPKREHLRKKTGRRQQKRRSPFEAWLHQAIAYDAARRGPVPVTLPSIGQGEETRTPSLRFPEPALHR